MAERPPVLSDSRSSLHQRYVAVRGFTESLCAPLETEDYVIQSMPEASPIRWHLAHTAWFFETFLLKPRSPGRASHNPVFEELFNSYYNAVGRAFARPLRGVLSRPTVKDVLEYRQAIDREVAQWIEGASEADLAGAMPVLVLGLHHEQQHQELMLTDLKHAFSLNPLRPAYRAAPDPPAGHVAPSGPELRWIPHAEGVVTVGHDGSGFAFDNESPRHRRFLEPFALASRPVTNREYLAFMEDGGYRNPLSWLSDGWNAAVAGQWEAPLYWERSDSGWRVFTLSGMQPLALDEPVCHVSHFEADAFARWAGARLPTEFEWEAFAAQAGSADSAESAAADAGCFAEDGRFHPRPLRSAREDLPGRLFGDVWEWTGSAYLPYPGFHPNPGALGEYNGKFMSGQMVLRGGSCATPRSHIRATYRNFFAPASRWQFTGFRLAKDPT